MEETTIREAEIGDSDVVNELYTGLDEQHRNQLPWLFQRPPEAARNAEFFASILADEKATVFVAIADRLAGFIHVRLTESPTFSIFAPQVRAVVDGLFVDPGYRRRGIGTQLLNAAETWSRRLGATGIDLSVYEFNREAQRLFSAAGYQGVRRVLSKSFLPRS